MKHLLSWRPFAHHPAMAAALAASFTPAEFAVARELGINPFTASEEELLSVRELAA